MHLLRTTLTLALLAFPSSAQQTISLLVEGDFLPGGGQVRSILGVDVASTGTWAAHVSLTGGGSDEALVRNGAPVIRRGYPVPSPAGAFAAEFVDFRLNDSGNLISVIALGGSVATQADRAVYWDTFKVVQKGDVSAAPQLGALSYWADLHHAIPNESGQLLVVGSVVDSSAPATPVDVLMLFENSGTTETVLWKTGDPMPGQPEAIGDLSALIFQSDFNDAGQVLFRCDLAGPAFSDGVIALDGVTLCQEGTPSVSPGRNVASHQATRLTLNNLGGYTYFTGLVGDPLTNLILVKDGAVYRQEGDPVPALPGGFAIRGFGTQHHPISDAGDVLWFAEFEFSDLLGDEALFVNDELLVREFITTIGGMRVTDLLDVSTRRLRAISSGGRYVLFAATLETIADGLFLIDRQHEWTRFCAGESACPCGNDSTSGSEQGCTNSVGVGALLSASGVPSITTDSLKLQVGGAEPNQLGIFVQNVSATAGATFYDGRLCLQNDSFLVRHYWPPAILPTQLDAGGAGVSAHSLSAADFTGSTAPGIKVHYQFWYRSNNGPCATGANFSSGISIPWLP